MKPIRAFILSVLIIGIGLPQQSQAEPVTAAIIFAGVAGLIVGSIISDSNDNEKSQQEDDEQDEQTVKTLRENKQMMEQNREKLKKIDSQISQGSVLQIASLVTALIGVSISVWEVVIKRRRKKEADTQGGRGATPD